MTKLFNQYKKDKIEEIRIEEIYDYEDKQYFYRIYYEFNNKIIILGESSVNPILSRYISRIF